MNRETIICTTKRAVQARAYYACTNLTGRGRRCRECKACVRRLARIHALLAISPNADILIRLAGLTGREADDCVRRWRDKRREVEAGGLSVHPFAPREPLGIDFDDPNPVTCAACGLRWHTAETCTFVESGGRRGLLYGSSLGSVL